ncbi:MAG: helix-turn-helix transcriptional regulator [Paracoccaceae bacterium]
MTVNWYSDEHATLGDRISAAREYAGLKQNDLAQRLGIRAKTLRDWENDLSEPRANRLQMLAALLGVSLRWLLTGEGDDIAPPSDEAAPRDPQMQAALQDVRSIRKDVVALADRLGRLEKALRMEIGKVQE